MLGKLVHRWIDLRREMVRTLPELGSPDRLAQLKNEIGVMLEARKAHLKSEFPEGGPGQLDERVRQIGYEADRELEVLKREVGLGMRPAASHSVTVNIQDSTVAALNLGTVMGNIQAVVASLQQGDPELATALRTLIEAVAADEALGDRRREVIELLTQIGEEATKPEDQRRKGLAKVLLGGVAAALAISANVAQIWQTYGPAITRHFGLPWP